MTYDPKTPRSIRLSQDLMSSKVTYLGIAPVVDQVVHSLDIAGSHDLHEKSEVQCIRF